MQLGNLEPALRGLMQLRIAQSSNELALEAHADPTTKLRHIDDAYDAFQAFLYITRPDINKDYGVLTKSNDNKLAEDTATAERWLQEQWGDPSREGTSRALELFRLAYTPARKLTKEFVVPPDDGDWPEEYWGMRLGSRMDGIRKMNRVRDIPDEWRQFMAAKFFDLETDQLVPSVYRPVMQLRPGERKWRFH